MTDSGNLSRQRQPGGGTQRPDLVVIGGSAGSIPIVMTILRKLPSGWPIPIVILVHTFAPVSDCWLAHLRAISAININEAEDQQALNHGNVYIAPHGFHLLVDTDRCLHLDTGTPVSASRPSIDVLFTSAAHAYRQRLLAVLLSGANKDGAQGLKSVSTCGGMSIVQDPADSEFATMPRAALQCMQPSLICTAGQIAAFFKDLGDHLERPFHDR